MVPTMIDSSRRRPFKNENAEEPDKATPVVDDELSSVVPFVLSGASRLKRKIGEVVYPSNICDLFGLLYSASALAFRVAHTAKSN